MESSAVQAAPNDEAGADDPDSRASRAEAARRLVKGTVLPAQQLRLAHESGIITAPTPIPDSHFQPASLDLRLGPTAYRLRCSFLPGRDRVEDAVRRYSMDEVDLRRGAVLEQNRAYLIPLLEELSLPPGMLGKVNPRSSTGRLDIFTRVVTDRSEKFDDIEREYRGKLFLEVVPRSFTIKVREGLALCQLRLMTGQANLTDTEIVNRQRTDGLLFTGGRPLPPSDIYVHEGLFLGVDLSGGGSAGGVVGYRARKNSHLLDLSKVGHYAPEDFWEPVHAEQEGVVVLEPEQFYLLYSRERVRLPDDLSAEMVPFDPSAGEVRTHYAGFFDPGFGNRPKAPGTHAVLEVRAHDVPFAIAHGQRLGKLALQELMEPSDRPYGEAIGSRYNERPLILLPRQFRPPPASQAKLWAVE
jgi:dCTP deaminase